MTASAAAQPLRGEVAFMRFWYARIAATMGNQMMMVALGWQVYDLTSSAWDLGLVGLLQFVPALLFTLPAGQVVDRVDRRLVLAAAVGLQALVALLLTLAAAGHWAGRELIFGLSVALGIARAFQMPAQQALTPLLVPEALLARAVAFSSAGTQFAIITGPALGGFVYALGAPWVYGLSVALFCLAVLLLARVRPRREPHRQVQAGDRGLRALFAGVNFIRHHPVMLGALSLDLFAVLLGGATALLPIFARDVLQVGPWGLGLLRGAPAAGALLTSAWLARHPLERRVGARMLAAVAVYGVAITVFSLSTLFWLSFAALLVSGGADMVSVIVRQSLVQLDTPDAMRGRVSAVNSVFIGASNQLGEFESGATAAWLGPVGSVLLGGVGTLVVVLLWLRLFPDLARRDRLRAAGAEG